jgi:hypothetical protein
MGLNENEKILREWVHRSRWVQSLRGAAAPKQHLHRTQVQVSQPCAGDCFGLHRTGRWVRYDSDCPGACRRGGMDNSR